MVKNSSLSSDIDFIKEFEELRLKQKILIESLNKKNQFKEKELLMEMNSKLDFLVKIFKDSADSDFNEKDFLTQNFKQVFDKMEEMRSQFDNSIKDINSRLEGFNVSSSSDPQSQKKDDSALPDLKTPEPIKEEVPVPPVEAPKAPENKAGETSKPETVSPSSQAQAQKAPSQPSKTESKIPEQEQKQTSLSKEPPAPDFVVDETKIEKMNQDAGKEKKKGWF